MDDTWESEPEEKWPRLLIIIGVLGLLGITGFVLVGVFIATLFKSPPPVPEPVAFRSVAGWGEFYDSSEDCKLSTDADKLTIEIPGTLHDLSSEYRNVNAPRVLRAVEGDFIASVIVSGSVEPAGRPTTTYAYPYQGAGLLVWQDSNNYVRLERAAILRDDRLVSYLNFEQRQRGQNINPRSAQIPDAPLHLRLERQTDRMIASFSPDGQQWTKLPEMAVKLEPGVKVGIAAVNTSTSAFRAEFEKGSVSGAGLKAMK